MTEDHDHCAEQRFRIRSRVTALEYRLTALERWAEAVREALPKPPLMCVNAKTGEVRQVEGHPTPTRIPLEDLPSDG